MHKLDPEAASSVCARGEGCEISRFSAQSEVPMGRNRAGIPISLLGAAAYLSLLALVARRRWRPSEQEPARLILAVAVLSALYSAYLAWVSIRLQGKLCPLCTVLYVCNLGVLIAAAVAMPESWKGWLSKVWRAPLSTSGAIAAVVFAVVVGAGYGVYAPPVEAAMAKRRTAQLSGAREIAKEQRFDLDVRGRPLLGDPNAPVAIVEVGDLQCPHCKTLYETLHELQSERPGDVRVSFLHYPLDTACNPNMKRPFHDNACAMAYASECALGMKRFDPMTRWLFAHPSSADRDAILEQAEALGLDPDAFAACLDAPETKAAIAADIAQGVRVGVKGTPVLFVDGRLVVGAKPREVIDVMVDAVLKEERGAAPAGAATK